MYNFAWYIFISPVVATLSLRATWPNRPFATSGRWIVDASGANATYAGVNWPAHNEPMVPEGLQYQSIEAIIAKVKSLGMNAIRLTYATEMVDEITERGEDVPLRTAFINALGQDNGTAIFDRVLKNNPSFTSKTTRLQVFDAVAAECAKQEMYIHLDNHVSKASWCCTPFDGNSWWGDVYFSTSNWTRGLSYMANHTKGWPGIVSMSLYNELRQPLTNMTLFSTSYNWQTWYENVIQGATAIHAANPDLLIFLPGMDSSTTFAPILQGAALTPGSGTFRRSDFAGFESKLVLEIHSYDIIFPVTNCTAYGETLFTNGFRALTAGATNMFPVMMTEFGYAQDATTWQQTYASCLRDYLAEQAVGWTIWVLAGSYYIRQGVQDNDEPWGLLTHDWSDWRSMAHVERGLQPLVRTTLDSIASNQTQIREPGVEGGAPASGGPQGPSASWRFAVSGAVWAMVVPYFLAGFYMLN